ncbi:hypothetical protein BX661DRAFT_132156, partial [Kickxella alabastrina]|uniref:uncharacterized protein n=1 Tax=Kickxella alabastrina TaxID=61397 RepID=UPI0022203D87
MKEREFQNMFTFSSGFVAARLTIPSADDIAEKDQKKTADKDQKKQTIGFAKFRTRADAIKARDVLTNRRVDADGVQVLKAELAKKDLYTWRTPFSLGLGTSKGATFGLDTPNTALGFQHKQQQPQTATTQPQQSLQSLQPVNTNDQNPPCNTLYVGNLPAGAMEEELRLIFQQALGFKRMSYRAKPCSGPMCFVEFDNIDFATLAMNELDGRMLSNSVGSGIRLSYSKNPLGVRSNQ